MVCYNIIISCYNIAKLGTLVQIHTLIRTNIKEANKNFETVLIWVKYYSSSSLIESLLYF